MIDTKLLKSLIKKMDYAIDILDKKYNFDLQEYNDIQILFTDIKDNLKN